MNVCVCQFQIIQIMIFSSAFQHVTFQAIKILRTCISFSRVSCCSASWASCRRELGSETEKSQLCLLVVLVGPQSFAWSEKRSQTASQFISQSSHDFCLVVNSPNQRFASPGHTLTIRLGLVSLVELLQLALEQGDKVLRPVIYVSL